MIESELVASGSVTTSYPGSYLRTPPSCGKTLVGAGHVTPQNLGCFQLAFQKHSGRSGKGIIADAVKCKNKQSKLDTPITTLLSLLKIYCNLER